MEGIDISFPHLGIKIAELGNGITIFGFKIAYYGIIMALSMLGGLIVARWQAKRTGQNPDFYSDFALYAIIFSVIGARLYYVIFSFDHYKDNLLQIFNTRGGGMALYGSVIGAVITAFVYTKKKKYSLALVLDTGVAGLLFGQILGRWGNFFNREAFGDYTDSFLAMRLKLSEVAGSNVTDSMREHLIVEDGIQYIQVHPTFLYESLWNVAVLILVIALIKKKKFDGEMFILYLVGYGLGRFWIEGLRTDQLIVPGTSIAVSQALSVVLVIGGVVYWILKRRKIKMKDKVEEKSSIDV